MPRNVASDGVLLRECGSDADGIPLEGLQGMLGYSYFHHQLQVRFDGSICRLIAQTLREPKLLGEGTRSRVYAIPAMDSFVLQVPDELGPLGPPPLTLVQVADPVPELNIGQPIAALRNTQVQILKRQHGETFEFPYGDLFRQYDIDDILGRGQPLDGEAIHPYQENYARHLALIARMPQSAFDDLALTLQWIKLCGLYVDPCSLNILVDSKRQRFNTVDHGEYIGPYENVLGMMFPLLDTVYVYLDEHATGIHDTPRVAHCPRLMALRQRILKKILSAALRSGLAFPEVACPKTVFGFHQPSLDANYALRICGIAMDWQDFVRLCQEQPLLKSPAHAVA